jgi:hypothetical protein
MDQSLETQGEVALTSIAPEIINVNCAAPDRTEACGSFVFNPATRALEIAPAYWDKAANALMRELRRTKLRLYFMFARLYCLKFALQSRSAVLRLLRKAVRDFSYLVVKDLEQIRTLRFPKPATMVGNSPVPTMDELPFKIVNMLGPATR